jgi:glutathione S-transferase
VGDDGLKLKPSLKWRIEMIGSNCISSAAFAKRQQGTKMKLYFTPGACSLAAHISLQESGVPYVIERVDLKSKKTACGDDFMTINPKGYVPALQFEKGVLTENVAVLQYIADLKPASHLAPGKESFERYRLVEWLGFISTEVHKGFKAFFTPDASEQEKSRAVEKLKQRLDYIEQRFNGNPFLMGDQFTVADAYLYTVLSWLPKAGIDLAQWPKTKRYHKLIGERSAVQEAQKAEQA